MRGSILTPFPVRNHPLRSMDHTSLGLSAAANGSLQGEALLRRFRRRTSPARSRMSPAVLGAGHDSPGSTSRSHATSFLGSQVGCSRPGRSKPLGHCARGPVGMAMRSSATVPQPLPAICLKAPDTLVAGLATNAKLAAQIHEAYSPCLPSLDEAYLLGFEVRLFPGQHIPPDEMTPIISQCVTHVPGLSVTNVPGLYPPQSSPSGRGCRTEDRIACSGIVGAFRRHTTRRLLKNGECRGAAPWPGV